MLTNVQRNSLRYDCSQLEFFSLLRDLLCFFSFLSFLSFLCFFLSSFFLLLLFFRFLPLELLSLSSEQSLLLLMEEASLSDAPPPLLSLVGGLATALSWSKGQQALAAAYQRATHLLHRPLIALLLEAIVGLLLLTAAQHSFQQASLSPAGIYLLWAVSGQRASRKQQGLTSLRLCDSVWDMVLARNNLLISRLGGLDEVMSLGKVSADRLTGCRHSPRKPLGPTMPPWPHYSLPHLQSAWQSDHPLLMLMAQGRKLR